MHIVYIVYIALKCTCTIWPWSKHSLSDKVFYAFFSLLRCPTNISQSLLTLFFFLNKIKLTWKLHKSALHVLICLCLYTLHSPCYHDRNLYDSILGSAIIFKHQNPSSQRTNSRKQFINCPSIFITPFFLLYGLYLPAYRHFVIYLIKKIYF